MPERVAVIGPCQMVAPLRNAGVDTFGCDTSLKAGETLEKAFRTGEYSVIFMTERMAEDCPEVIARIEDKVNILLIPDHNGPAGMFREKLDELIRQATGALKT